MADISYTPTTWADGSGGGTPIDAAKLNNIESGISDAVAAIGPNDTTEDGTLKAQIDALGESVSNISTRTWYSQAYGNVFELIINGPSARLMLQLTATYWGLYEVDENGNVLQQLRAI